MKIAYFDCIAGASGDMILGAFLDAGLSFERLKSRLSALNIPDYELQVSKVNKNGFSATKLDVLIGSGAPVTVESFRAHGWTSPRIGLSFS